MISEPLTQGPIQKRILQMAIPMSVGLFFNTMFNVVDTFYAGRLGMTSLAGMSASFSVFFILTAIASGLGTGLAALLAISIGQHDQERVERYTVNGLFLTLGMSILLTVLGLLFAPNLLLALGARGPAFEEGARYVRGIYAGAIFFALNATLNALLTARGMTKPYRNFLIFGFFLNALLDPMLIFGWFGLPRLGTLGVAIATVICQAVGTVYMAWKVHKLLGWRPERRIWKLIGLPCQFEILSQGIPAALNMLTIAIGIFVINFFIYRFGNDAGIAGYGAAVRIEQIALLPALGLNSATLAMVGQNYGAGRLDRVRETFMVALRIGVIIMTIGMILVYPFAPQLVSLFNDDKQVIAEGARYLRTDFFAFNGYVILNICVSFLQGLKRPQYAIYIGIYRQLVMPVLLFNFLGVTLGLGLAGIWWGIVFTVWTGAFIMLLLTRREYSRIVRLQKPI